VTIGVIFHVNGSVKVGLWLLLGWAEQYPRKSALLPGACLIVAIHSESAVLAKVCFLLSVILVWNFDEWDVSQVTRRSILVVIEITIRILPSFLPSCHASALSAHIRSHHPITCQYIYLIIVSCICMRISWSHAFREKITKKVKRGATWRIRLRCTIA